MQQPAKPRESLAAIQQRLKRGKIFNDELAEYFSSRRELEEAYLKQLQKIAKRTFLSDPSSIPPGFVPVFERLIQELAEVANIHSELEKRIADECEAVIRNASSSGEWLRLREHDDSLGNTVRELNSLETQLAKDQKKLEGASAKKAGQAQARANETERSIAQTTEIWETEAPFAFEAYQRVDAQRLELLKEVVAKFETAQSDAAQRRMQISEKTMQECLNFDTQADMQEFILKNGVAATGARNGRAAAPPSRPVRRGSVAGRSVSSRNRTNGMGEFGASTTSFNSVDRSNTGPPSETATPSKSGGSTLRSAFSRIGRRKDKDSSNAPSAYGSLPEEPSASRDARPPMASSSSRPSQLGVVGEDSIDASAPGGTGLMAPLAPSSNSTPAPQVDSEGFTIPPPDHDRKPWEMGAAVMAAGTAAGAGGAAASSLLDDDDPNDSRGTIGDQSVSSRMTGMNINSKPISEDSDKDKAALERMRSTLGAPQRRATTSRRDRRDVRNTTFIPGGVGLGGGDESRMSQFGVMTNSPGPSSPFSTSGGSTFTGQPGVGGHRTQSMTSMASANPFELSTSTGVRASLTERVNVIFAGREVSKVMVVGELSVSLRDVAATSKPLHVRIAAFEQLEKAAPNPAFLAPVPDRAGEYLLDVKALLDQDQGQSASGTVVLKYQVHVSEARKAQFAPLSVHAQWRCEPHQTSFLLTYASTLPDTHIIQDIQFALAVQPSTVTNVMTKPTGTWAAESKTMFWKLPEGVAGHEPRKLLARFQIEGQQSTPQPVFVKWKIQGHTLSTLGIEVVDAPGTAAQDGIKIDEVVRLCVAGKYIGGP